VQELEDVFHDAKDYFNDSVRVATRTSNHKKDSSSFKINGMLFENNEESKGGEPDEPATRDVLPYFKDPKLKISIWTIIKDSMGKDITKMSVPVYFNDPTNIL
jgi:hypothetical protein